jgi:predicted amidohydrolase YtcJ
VRVDALFRGRFTTFDADRPNAATIAVLGGRIVAIDAETDSLEAASREDFGARPVFPGFHDAHAHTPSFGIALGELDLSTPPVRSLEQLYGLVTTRSASLEPGAWLIGSGYDQNKLGGLHPTRQRLDEAAGRRPVWLQHTSGHMCVVNSAVLDLIGPRARDPIDGGVVELGPDGQPTGLLEERAQSLAQSLVLPRPIEEIAAAIGAAHERYLAEGITSVCDAGIAGGWIAQSPVELAAFQLARDTARLRVRTTVMIASDVLHGTDAHAGDGIEQALDAGIRTGLGDEWLRLGPLKVFSDGSLIGRTCWMHEPFSDRPGNMGYPQADPAELRRTIIAAHRAGWQVATHAVGDAAVSFVLDCYAEALDLAPRPDHRHRIEHCAITTDESLARIAALGVIPVPQGRFVGEIGDGMLAALGPERGRLAYRLKGFLEAGVALPGSSDRPVVDGRPLLGIADMVRRRTESGQSFGPGEALTAEEALVSYCAGSAYATRTERDRGTLSVGKLADFVVLEDDPRRVAPEAIGDIAVTATVVGGELAYRAP